MVSNTKYRGKTNQQSNLEDLEIMLAEKEREVKREAGRRKEEINTLKAVVSKPQLKSHM